MADQSQRAHLRAIAVPGDARARARARHPAGRASRRPPRSRARRPPPRSRRAICARCSGARSTTTTRAISISCRWRRRCRAATSRCWSRLPTSTPRSAKGSPVDRHAALNTTSVYTPGGDLSDAARAAVDRSDVAQRPSGSPRGRDRVRRLAGRRREGVGHLRRVGEQQGQARLQRRRRVAGRRRSAAAGGGGGARHGRSSCACRIGVAQALDGVARASTARSGSRRSRSRACSTATRCTRCGRRRRTAPSR